MYFEIDDVTEIKNLLLSKRIGVLPTDTIYGLHCLAFDNELAEKIYQIKKRPESKKFINIISKVEDLRLFDIELSEKLLEIISHYWPGRNTLIFSDLKKETHAIRLPEKEFLISILNETGPLVSTSANLTGMEVPNDIQGCINIFGDTVDFYVDGGVLNNPPSNIYKFVEGNLEKIR